HLLFILCLAFVVISCANSSKSVESANQNDVLASTSISDDEDEEDDMEQVVDKYADADLPPLHAACNHDVIDKDLVRRLVAEGYDINEYSIDRVTPLRLACNRSHIDKEAIKLLVELGAHVRAIDDSHRTTWNYSPMTYVCDRSDIDADALRLLFELGAEAENWTEKSDGTALLRACNRSDIDVEAVRILIENGANLKVTERDLSLAMIVLDHEHYSKEAFELLIDSGLDVNLGYGPSQNKLITMVVHDLELTKKVVEKAKNNKPKTFSEDEMKSVEEMMRYSEYDERAIAAVKEKMVQKNAESTRNPIDVIDKEGTGVLSYAAAWGNKDVVQYLLDQGLSKDINKPNEKGLTPIFFAAYSGNLDVVKLLVNAGADVHIKDKANNNVLVAACRGEKNKVLFKYTSTRYYQHYASDLLDNQAPDPEMIKFFLDAGVPAYEANNDGMTPLHYAAQNALTTPETIKLLIKNGADPNAEAKKDKRTPLMIARAPGVAEALIKKGADIHAVDTDGWTALHYAFDRAYKKEDIETIRVLIKSGADIYAKTNSGKNIADIADTLETYKLLDEMGVDLTNKLLALLQNSHPSFNPLTILALIHASKIDDISKWSSVLLKGINELGSSSYKKKKVQAGIQQLIRYLIEHGTDINRQDDKGMTLLMQACNYEPIIFKELVEQGADIHQKTALSTPLAYCASRVYGHGTGPQNIQLLIERGANVNVSDSEGVPAIVHVSRKAPKLVPAMLKAGANPNATDPEGNTPLMVTESYNAVKALVEAGADVNARNHKGISVIAIHSGANYNADRFGDWWGHSDKTNWNQGDYNIAKLLIDAGAQPDATTMQYTGNPKIVGILKNAKNDVLLTSEQLMSSPNLTPEMVKRYMASGGDQDVIDEALLEACMEGNGSNIIALVKGGADPNTRYQYKDRTPLMVAVQEDQEERSTVTLESIKALIDAGARINDSDEEGETALMAACVNYRKDGDR
ncbi:MAG: ankyrin repeat domain-containing protein, partial [Proteobacteria bacterium]|nr:ankyrin repeat domain-containing protein [Pseudomonadota bacterium]